MVGILIDVDTGDPYISPDTGNTVIVDDLHAFKQIIYGIFNCRPGSEILNVYYGFDLEMALRVSHLEDSELFIQSLIAEALDPKKEKLISNVNFIQVEKDPTIPNKVNIVVDLNSISGDNIQLGETIGDQTV